MLEPTFLPIRTLSSFGKLKADIRGPSRGYIVSPLKLDTNRAAPAVVSVGYVVVSVVRGSIAVKSRVRKWKQFPKVFSNLSDRGAGCVGPTDKVDFVGSKGFLKPMPLVFFEYLFEKLVFHEEIHSHVRLQRDPTAWLECETKLEVCKSRETSQSTNATYEATQRPTYHSIR